MCIYCAQTLIQSMDLDYINSLKLYDLCPTESCGGYLKYGYLCRAYQTKRFSLHDGSLGLSNNYSISEWSHCFQLYNMKRKMGLSSPCDKCMYDEDYRGPYEFYYCSICGFFIIHDKSEIGYIEWQANKSIITHHHADVLNQTLNAACNVMVLGHSIIDLSESQRGILQLEGYISNSDFTDNGLKLLRDRISVQSKSQEWIEKSVKDKVQFIWYNNLWRKSSLLSQQKPLRDVCLFIDVNILRSSLGPSVFERVSILASDDKLTVEELFKNPEIKIHHIILFLILRDMVLCKINELELSEIMAELASANIKSKDHEYLVVLWSEIMNHLESYMFDVGTLQVASVLSRIYTEIMKGKEADPKDAYHFVFCVQHNINTLITNDKFLRSMPTFLECIDTQGIDNIASRCFDIYKMLYPTFTNIFKKENIYEGFKNLMLSRVKTLGSDSPIDEVKRILIG